MGRAPCCEKVGLKKGRWTAEEDEKLMKYIQENGEGSWRSLPKNAGLLRCGKSCRLRWINYLRADLKRGNITTEEEEIIIKLHSSYGNRWSLIAGHLPGRTDNEIKNYWNSHLSRRIHSFKRPNDEVPVIMDMGKIAGGPRRKGGKASKSKKDNNASNVENRKEKENDSDKSIPSIPLKEKEASSEISVQHEGVGPQHNNGVGVVPDESVVLAPPQVVENGILGHDEETGSWAIGPIEEREDVCMDPLLERESGSVGPIDVLEDDIFFPDEVIESGLMLMGTDEERESGLSDANEKRENMVMDVREEGESGLMGETSEGKSDEWSSSIGSCFDEVRCIQNEWLDCGWEGMWDPMMDGSEILSSLWESDSGEGHLHGITESEQEKFASWLLSTDTNVM